MLLTYPDIVLNVPRIIITGKIAVFIENHKGIVEYNSNCENKHPDRVICIKGQNLIMKSIIADEITVEGRLPLSSLRE